MIRAMLIVTVLSLGMLGQPKEAVCSNCYARCYTAGSYCGYQCVCGCHQFGGHRKCICFTIYEVPQALTDGYAF